MKIALFADYHGEDRIWPFLEEALEDQRLDLIVFAGGILESEEREAQWQQVLSTGKAPRKSKTADDEDGVVDEIAYREFFVNLSGFGVPVVFVPGHLDSPTSLLMETVKGFSDACNVESSPFKTGDYTFVGRGGALGPVDADEKFYCSKERTFKKHFASGFDSDPAKTILLVHTLPISSVELDTKADNHAGAKAINDVIDKLQPAFCFCAHAHSMPGQDTLGATIVVNPGSMYRGRYALIDMDSRRVLFPTPLKV